MSINNKYPQISPITIFLNIHTLNKQDMHRTKLTQSGNSPFVKNLKYRNRIECSILLLVRILQILFSFFSREIKLISYFVCVNTLCIWKLPFLKFQDLINHPFLGLIFMILTCWLVILIRVLIPSQTLQGLYLCRSIIYTHMFVYCVYMFWLFA